MDVPRDRQHLDPYEVHKENMQMLKVLPVSHNKSAPNSPMMRRSKDKAVQKANFLSPSPQRKDFKKVTEESRSRSLTHLTPEGRISPRNLSPAESPVGSPRSVSERIIKTHFLSNTTGKPGSYLLKKSDKIIKNKESPTGSPMRSVSPIPRRAISPMSQRKPNANTDKFSAPVAIPVVISPAVESKIGFEVPLENQGATQDNAMSKMPIHHKKETALPVSSVADTFHEGQNELENIRESIGLALKPKPPPPPPPVVKKKKKGAKGKASSEESSKSLKKKPKRHHYPKYGGTNQSPGLLSPPREHRGSSDLSAEMAKWERKERKHFNDLDHVEEASSTGDEDHSSLDENQGPARVFAMPPVFDNIPHQLETRDFSIPLDIQGEIDDETWEQIKKTRYLRIEGQQDDEDGEEEYSIDSAEDDDDEEDEADEENSEDDNAN